MTASSIETWKGTRAMFGRVVEVRLGGPQEALAVSYTHLDVYKRQPVTGAIGRVATPVSRPQLTWL